ncbi:dna excision repair protein ercc-3 [Lasius niger]|uniref:Dna excision repair protein ercc-3 n=1 Tax=Lasius niger TaxID=67767 RepID=A0A0J7K7V0_LASNI|nr:dna excision repair protein ercc-3 [Lasius niger]
MRLCYHESDCLPFRFHGIMANLPGGVVLQGIHDDAGIITAIVSDVCHASVLMIEDNIVEIRYTAASYVIRELINTENLAVVFEIKNDETRRTVTFTLLQRCGSTGVEYPHATFRINLYAVD